ncbi:MAG: lysophospholipid acyltransferase family protein [Deltaproteobacteria bacterium]|nr:lysophospholipid acyltransferase family protein [Deltaproteobacteria bacterium]
MSDKSDPLQRTDSFPLPAFCNIFDAFMAAIPARHIVNLGKLAGALFYYVDVPHRRIVRRNLQFVHPDWSLDQVEILSKKIFQNVTVTVLEIIQLASLSCEEISDRITIHGDGHIQRALELKRGLIMISAHIGSWEAGLQFLSCFCQAPITGVAKKIRFKPLHRWLNRLRVRFGMKIIDKKGALPRMRQTLRRGEVIGLLIDQSKRSESVDVDFLGKRVTAPSAAAFLALRCQSPVLPVFCIRGSHGHINIRVGSPLNLRHTGDLRTDLIANTQMMMDIVEDAVRSYPDQWLWMHKRWKKHYPHLYPEYFARRQRRKQREQRRLLEYRRS